MKKTTCSCPGKALITGGYLILERPNTGIVIAGSSRFYCTVISDSSNEINITPNYQTNLKIESPQFKYEQKYTLDWREDQIKLDPIGKNKFIELSVIYTLQVIKGISDKKKFEEIMNSKELKIVIIGDNSFYSQLEFLKQNNLPLLSSSFEKIPFSSYICPIQDMKKTGLGSSAAMVTSIVSSLLQHFEILNFPSNETQIDQNMESIVKCHNLAQFCHCLAQGKIGSGFDVSSACFGSQIYQRFSPNILEPLLENATKGKIETKLLLSQLNFFSDNSSDFVLWDCVVLPFRLPSFFTLLLADISAGSESPSMAKNVLSARKDPKIGNIVNSIWNTLATENKKIEVLFSDLNKLECEDSHSFNLQIISLSEKSHDEWDSKNSKLEKILNEIRSVFLNIRKNLKLLGDYANTPIEPQQQTQLVDKTFNFPGVLISGVPGAGGYDAIFAIVLHNNVVEKLELMWSKIDIKGVTVVPLPVRSSNIGICNNTDLCEKINSIN